MRLLAVLSGILFCLAPAIVTDLPAETEPAWQGCGQEVGLKIWRIVEFQVTDLPEEEYGSFYNGDSYIILNTYKANEDSEKLSYDVHFWIGKYSTQDESSTAAYKTEELDTFLDDRAVQHREVDGHESDLLLSYFTSFELLPGGVDSGFQNVTPEEYRHRLLKFSGTHITVTVTEVPRSASRVSPADVFVLDAGLQIFQYNGGECNRDEKFKAFTFVQELMDKRPGAKSEVLEEHDAQQFFDMLDEEDEEDEDETDDGAEKRLYKVSYESGQVQVTEVYLVSSVDELDPNDVYVLDNGQKVFVWVGSGANPKEKTNGYSYAHKIHDFVPVVSITPGLSDTAGSEFDSAIAG